MMLGWGHSLKCIVNSPKQNARKIVSLGTSLEASPFVESLAILSQYITEKHVSAS